MELEPRSGVARSNLGAALTAEHRYADAVAELERAVALRPGYAEAWNNLGISLEALRRSDEAEAAYRRAIAERLAAAVSRGSNNDAVKKKYAANGVEPEFSTPAEYQAQIAADFKSGGQLIRSIGLRADK